MISKATVEKTEKITNGAASPVGARLYAKLILVTPEMAAGWLAKAVNFRPLDKPHALRIAGDIKQNGWRLNGETFKLNRAGQMIDGQHRAFAIVHLKISVHSLVAHDVEDDAGVDEGRRRTINQHLRHCGEKYTDSLASAIKYTGLWARGRLHISGGESAREFTNNDLLRLLQEHPELRSSVVRAASLKKIGAASGQVAMLHYLAVQAGLGVEIEQFLSDLEHGTGLQEDDPVWRLREKFMANRSMRAKLPPLDKLALLVRAWGLWLTGRRCRVLRWNAVGPAAESFPELVLTRPAEREPAQSVGERA